MLRNRRPGFVNRREGPPESGDGPGAEGKPVLKSMGPGEEQPLTGCLQSAGFLSFVLSLFLEFVV